MKPLLIWVMVLFPVLLHAEKCSQSGQSLTPRGWSRQLRGVCLTDSVTANTFRSPDQTKTIVADGDGFHLKVDGKSVEWPEGKELVARGSEVSWSPTSSAFFINYGDGSGLDGWTLKVYVVSDGRVVNHDEISQQIVHRFRTGIGCLQTAVDPNVRGLGWSEGGTHIFAFAQATVNESCGQQGDFRGVVAGLAGETIEQFYSEADTKRHFHNLLPFNMR
jgi:hypothetical protein